MIEKECIQPYSERHHLVADRNRERDPGPDIMGGMVGHHEITTLKTVTLSYGREGRKALSTTELEDRKRMKLHETTKHSS